MNSSEVKVKGGSSLAPGIPTVYRKGNMLENTGKFPLLLPAPSISPSRNSSCAKIQFSSTRQPFIEHLASAELCARYSLAGSQHH